MSTSRNLCSPEQESAFFADIPLQIMVTQVSISFFYFCICVVRASLYFFSLYFCICNCCAWLSDIAWPSLVTSDAQGSLYFSPGKIRCHYFTKSAFSSWSNTNTNTQFHKYKVATKMQIQLHRQFLRSRKITKSCPKRHYDFFLNVLL